MSTLQSKTITIISVTGSQEYAQGSAYAIMRSYTELQKKLPVETLKCVLVSPQKPEICPDYITHIPCQPFGYFEYSYFIIFCLDQLVESDYALVVQDDGFVINGDNWRDEFFDYDYIGAPLNGFFNLDPNNGTAQLYGAGYFEENPTNPERFIESQNGGFSLRSKRFLALPRKMNLSWEVLPPKPFKTAPLKFDYDILLHHEDLFLTVKKRSQMEKMGIKFAPNSVAAYFAVESFVVPQKLKTKMSEIMGIHTISCLSLIGTNEVVMKKKLNMHKGDPKTNSLTRFMLACGFSIKMPAEYYLEGRDEEEQQKIRADIAENNGSLVIGEK